LSHEAIWLTRLIRPIWSGGKSLYDRVVGKAPHLNFELDEGGVKLIVHNARQETIIVESVRTDPSVLGFSTGHSVREIAAAVTAQRNPPNDEALAVIPPGERCPLTVITFDPFEKSPPKQAIKVITHWHSSTHGPFSERTTTLKTSIRDIRVMKRLAEQKPYRSRPGA
jgi:hypothetical protein